MNGYIKKDYMKWLKLFIRIVIVFSISKSAGMGMRIVSGIIRGEHGAPSFVTPSFTTFGIISEILLIIAFLLLGKYVPIKNRIMKSMLFILLYWASAYIPQVFGMLGGKSAVLAEEAISVSTILIDSLSYVVKGVVYGFLLEPGEVVQKREADGKKILLSCVTSMALFPALLAVMEFIIGFISSDLYSVNSFVIDKNDLISFYIVFYALQALSGFLFPVLYRDTEYNRKHKWFYFASIYAWLLWTPIVLIVALFGINVVNTVIWALIMIIAIYADTAVFTKIMEK